MQSDAAAESRCFLVRFELGQVTLGDLESRAEKLARHPASRSAFAYSFT